MFYSNIIYILLVIAGLLLRMSRPGLKQLLELALLGAVASMLWLLSKLAIAAYHGRRMIALSSHGKTDFVGKPLLFPARLSHARRFPQTERYNYWYDYFMIGIPVGPRCRIGSLISIDNRPDCERPWEKCWFTIDPAYYLDPGSGVRSLEEQLHIFLQNLGENPQEFPHAYLISVPRFLWWQKSAISYWYLYSSTRELRAMIMEINNSFYEKRNIFFRLTGDSIEVNEPEYQASTVMASTKGTRESLSLCFHSSASKSKHFKGSWEKAIFGSPFEKVGGSMSAKFVDALRGPSLQSNLSSNDPNGQVKVTSRLASWGEPVDPVIANSWTIARFVASWTHVGALFAPRIVKEALRIRLRGNLKYLQRPEVRSGSNSRKETRVERSLEPFFREYLSQLAVHCPFPCSVEYLPPKTLHFDRILFHSPVAPTSHPRPVVSVQLFTPRFYTSFPENLDQGNAFAMETAARPTDSDPDACYLRVSDPSLLEKVLATAGQCLDAELVKSSQSLSKHCRGHGGASKALVQSLISILRGSSRETFMDRFVFHSNSFSPSQQWSYLVGIMHSLLARRLPVESQAIVALGFIAARTMLVTALLVAGYRIWAQDAAVKWLREEACVTPATGALVYAGWEMVQNYIGQYYLNPFAWGVGL
ncbi:hypothetical protein BDW62DRAFT_218974 [Aspergillus aurantiobrunneus]